MVPQNLDLIHFLFASTPHDQLVKGVEDASVQSQITRQLDRAE